jgi:hypothetical protein
MKTILLFLLLSVTGFSVAQAHGYKPSPDVISVQTFYNELAPYGDWVYSSDYGFVWKPGFDYPEDFRPYSSGGNWVYTAYGWTWVSDYNWGWATFHYGGWFFDDYLGWMWVPGTQWAPAWVSWGTYRDCYGWAPMGPDATISAGFGWQAPDLWWTFIPRRHFCSENWYNFIDTRPVFVNHITVINTIYTDDYRNSDHVSTWYRGPRVSEVERYNGRVRRMEVSDCSRPDYAGLRNDRLNLYRPGVDNRHRDYQPESYRDFQGLRTEHRLSTTSPQRNNPGVIRSRNMNENHESSVRTVRNTTPQVKREREEPVNPERRENAGTRVNPGRGNTPSSAGTRDVNEHRNSVPTPPAQGRPEVRPNKNEERQNPDRSRGNPAANRQSPGNNNRMGTGTPSAERSQPAAGAASDQQSRNPESPHSRDASGQSSRTDRDPSANPTPRHR